MLLMKIIHMTMGLSTLLLFIGRAVWQARAQKIALASGRPVTVPKAFKICRILPIRCWWYAGYGY